MMAKRFLYIIAIIIFSIVNNIFAQLPHSFNLTARNAHYHGEALDLTMNEDGILFVANGRNGLCAYVYDGNSYVLTAHVDDGSEFESARSVAVGPNGTIFLAMGSDGLFAYSYDGNSFIQIDHINDGGKDTYALDVSVSSDGTIFLANNKDGLRAYTFDGNSFTNTASFDDRLIQCVTVGPNNNIYTTSWFNFSFLHIYNYDGNSLNEIAASNISQYGYGHANDIGISKDGTIFIAFEGSIELGAFIFSNGSITNTAYISTGNYYEYAVGLTVVENIIFITNADEGILVYEYKDNSFTEIDRVNNGGIAFNVLTNQNKVFIANGEEGIREYLFIDNSLNLINHIPNIKFGIAEGIAIINDSTICLANGQDGLRIYHFNDSNFSTLAHFDNDGYGNSVAEGPNGMIAFANGIDGLRLFSFNGTTIEKIGHVNDGGYAYSVAIDSEGNIFLANGNDGLRVYTYNGSEIQQLAHINDYRVHHVFIDLENIIYVKDYYNGGLYLFKFRGTDLNSVGQIQCSAGSDFGITINNDGIIFIADGGNGLDAYIRNNHSIQFISNINDGKESFSAASDVSIGADGTLFLANTYDGLRAYTFDGNTFVNTAHIDEGYSIDVEVSSNNTIFVANAFSGLHAYKYSGLLSVFDQKSNYSNSYILQQNRPNPFNPETNISYSIPFETNVVIKIFNVLGEEIEAPVDKTHLEGNYNFLFNGKALPSGIYFYQLQTDRFVDTKKMILMR